MKTPPGFFKKSGGVFVSILKGVKRTPLSIACSVDYKVALRYANRSFCNL